MRRAPKREPRRHLGWMLVLALLGPLLLNAGGPAEPVVPAEIESTAPVGTVLFPHLYHVDELGFACEDCHHETAAGPLNMPHPDYLLDYWVECESCHRTEVTAAKPQSCGACHGPAADIADQTLSSKVAVHRSCWQCHEVGTGAAASRGCAFCHEVDNDDQD